ncbi:MAG: hypothetical protein ABFS43_10485 [Thermodesulfobacteriota bacterium]
MIIQRAGVLKFLRYLGIFCAITMGFFSIVATSEEDAKDALGVEIPFEGDAEIELDPVTVEKADEVAPTEGDPDCPDVTVQQVLDDALAGLIDGVTVTGDDVDTITLNYASSNYTVAWSGAGAVTDITCWLTITGLTTPAQSIELDHTVLQNSTGSVHLDADELAVINFYLQNRTEQFEYCYTCTSTAGIDDYTAEFTLEIGVTVEGEY